MTNHSKARDMGDRLLTAVKDNPEGLLLFAAGCALLLRSKASAPRARQSQDYRPGQRDDRPGTMSQTGSSLYGKVSDAAETARDYVSDVADKVGETAGSYASSAAQTAGSYASSAAQYADDARRTVSEKSGRFAEQAQATVRDNFKRVLREQPLAVAFAGLAAGVAVASAFPTTELEKQALGSTGEFVADVAAKTGERLKEAASKAGEQLKTEAQQRGLDAEGMKEMVHEAASTFGSAVSGEKNDAPGTRSFTGGSNPMPGSAATGARPASFPSPESPGRTQTSDFGTRPVGPGAWKPGSNS